MNQTKNSRGKVGNITLASTIVGSLLGGIEGGVLGFFVGSLIENSDKVSKRR